ncbi:MAG: hypothetical protein WDN04_00745 [Rhodospirillales bacterium]
MQEVNLVADLLIAMREGIQPKKRIKAYYDIYEKEGAYEDDVQEVTRKFDAIISMIGTLYPEGIAESEFSRNHVFYSLFTAVAHCFFGLKDSTDKRGRFVVYCRSTICGGPASIAFEEMFEIAGSDVTKLTPSEREFIQDSRRATTDWTGAEALELPSCWG